MLHVKQMKLAFSIKCYTHLLEAILVYVCIFALLTRNIFTNFVVRTRHFMSKTSVIVDTESEHVFAMQQQGLLSPTRV